MVPTGCEAGPSTGTSPIPTAKAPGVVIVKARGNLRKRSVDTAIASHSTPVPHDVVNAASQPSGRHPGFESSSDRPEDSSRKWLRFAESCVNYIGPYDELQEAEAKADDHQMEVVLARLVTEWQSVGQMVCPQLQLHSSPLLLIVHLWHYVAYRPCCGQYRGSRVHEGEHHLHYRRLLARLGDHRGHRCRSWHGDGRVVFLPIQRDRCHQIQGLSPTTFTVTHALVLMLRVILVHRGWRKTCTERTSSSASSAGCRRSTCSCPC